MIQWKIDIDQIERANKALKMRLLSYTISFYMFSILLWT